MLPKKLPSQNGKRLLMVRIPKGNCNAHTVIHLMLELGETACGVSARKAGWRFVWSDTVTNWGRRLCPDCRWELDQDLRASLTPAIPNQPVRNCAD